MLAGSSRDETLPSHRLTLSPGTRLPRTRHARLSSPNRSPTLGVRPFPSSDLDSRLTGLGGVVDWAYGSRSLRLLVLRRSLGGRGRRERERRCSTWGAFSTSSPLLACLRFNSIALAGGHSPVSTCILAAACSAADSRYSLEQSPSARSPSSRSRSRRSSTRSSLSQSKTPRVQAKRQLTVKPTRRVCSTIMTFSVFSLWCIVFVPTCIGFFRYVRLA